MFGLLAVILAISSSLIAAAPVPTKPAFREHREAESDLKITGLIQDVPRGQSRFVPWKFLASLPEHEAIVAHNQNFPDLPQGALKIGGIYLDSLAEVLGAGRSTDVIEAVCKDGYTSTYTTEYVNQHHPIFALTVAGLTAHEWAKRNHQYDPGPYFITYEQFVPAFQILSHVDRPQEPAEVVELHFDKVERVYGSITPKQSDAHPADRETMQGFRIAQQNCFRCHNAGVYGGTKAGRSWHSLAKIAASRPEHFAAWIHNPQAIDPKAEMPPNLEYDQATLDALTRYFQSISARGE